MRKSFPNDIAKVRIIWRTARDRAYFLLSPNIVFPKAYEIHTCSKKLRMILTKASPLHICLMRRQSWQNPL